MDTRRRARPRPTRAGARGVVDVGVEGGPAAPHASGGPRGRRRARGGGAGRPRPGTVPGRMGHQDPAPLSRPASERGPCCSRPGRRGTALRHPSHPRVAGLTPGQAGDCPMMIPVLEAISAERPARGRPRTRPDRVLADRAYSSRANRDWLRAHHIRATIQAPTPRQPSSPNQPHQTTSMSPRTDKPNNRPRQFASADATACCSMLVWSGPSPAKRLSDCSDLTEDHRLYLTHNECCIMPLRHTCASTLIIDIANQALIYESE